MAKDITLRQFVINNLRRASFRWPAKNRAKNRAKIARNQYRCELCSEVHPNKNVRVDHREPVVPLTGFPKLPDGRDDWSTYIERLYCSDENFQLICCNCHDKKTDVEREIRKANRKKK
jgi:hypothetical protein